ncbi:chemotaxis protein CheA [Nostoc sp. FACHB-110]|uniref:chemotaxis protein CheA n=1 Tax=Nostoc sp. FACHB-110 TaxID=2692834 RepID=UPI0016882BD6|nr:chemotaxis protein CheA [Nostoc sp. FACHB-110]MBD2439477.1 chemotaxis protein CheA [Nostoc sp. FACHB-110]
MGIVDIDDDDLEAFLVESFESVAQIESSIIALESNLDNPVELERIYRSLHTLKGNCGFLPFSKLESIAHAGESLLSYLRDGFRSDEDIHNWQLTAQIISLLLQTVDTIRQLLSQIQTTKHEGNEDYTQLIQALTQLPQTQKLWVASSLPQVQPMTLAASESAYVRVNVSLLDQLMNLVGELVLARNQVMGLSHKIQDTSLSATCQRLNLITTELQDGIMKTRLQPISTIWQKFPRVIRDLAIANGKQVQVQMQGEDTELDKSIIEAIKDPLTHLVRNCIDHGIESPSDRTAHGKPSTGKIFLKALHENGKVTIEIGDDGQGLSPIKIKHKAQQLGLISPAQAQTINDTEAINLIFLPGFSTTEQVTNLSGRGVGMAIVKSNIEKINGSIEIYNQLGKGTTFKLKIPLTVTIIPALIISSDGDRYTIPQSNLQELVRLEPEQALTQIEIFYDVPVYRLREQLIPLVYLNQILQPATPHTPHPTPHSALSTQHTPLSTPHSALSTQHSALSTQHSALSTQHSALNIVIIQTENYQFGLVVDTIEDIQEIVVKPLGNQLKSLSLFAGATIMGDGKVGLIIDVVNLAKQAQLNDKQKQLPSSTSANIKAEISDRQMILLFEGPQKALMGIPVARALRLERVPQTAVEQVGNQAVVRILDKILPIIDLQSIFPSQQPNLEAQTETLQLVIVSLSSDLSVALVVERILDIVEESLTIQGIPSRPGVLFCAVIKGQITEILDIETIIKIANPYLLQVSERG